MRYIKNYTVHISLSELLDFLPQDYIELLCKRLHVSVEEFSKLNVFEAPREHSSFMITHSVEGN